jgi:plastocyanin
LLLLAFAAGFLLLPEAAAGGGGCHEQKSTEGSGDAVKIHDSGCFSPTVLHVEPGRAVTFSNAQGVPHNVHGLDWGTWVKGGDVLMEGDAFAHTFTATGYYPYACTLHANMVGLVIVGDPEGEAPTASAATVEDGDGGMSATAWSLIAAGGLAAVGMIGGGAFLRYRRAGP